MKALAHLKIGKAAVEGERRTVEADLGGCVSLSTLIGPSEAVIMRWFILAVTLLLEPAAVLLLLAARGHDHKRKAARRKAIGRAEAIGGIIAAGRPEKRMGEAP